jgi:hypothetical protein
LGADGHLFDGTAKSILKLFQLHMMMMPMSSGKSCFSRSVTPIERLSALIERRTISIGTETPAIIPDGQKSKPKADKIQSTSITSVA